jgi:two-component system NarL family sensor kinase
LLDPAGQTVRPEETRARDALLSLRSAEGAIMDSCLRLRIAERTLADLVRQKQRRPGRSAVRQVESERRRLGRELHTGVGQLLAAIRVQSELIATHLLDPEPPVAHALERIGTLVQDSLEQVRAISSRLYPPSWQQTPLGEALLRLWNLSGIPERYQATLQVGPLAWEPDLEIKILIYRAAQEGLSNIARHSHAGSVIMTLDASEDRLVLRVQDDGVGFDPALAFPQATHTAAGIGLRTISDQAEGLGGRISLESGLHGTTLEVSVPRSG